jgi:predicted nucleotidyltransferase
MTRRAPRCIRSLLDAFTEALTEAFRRELVGLYVFGSAAFPGFVPGSGDIDFIAVTRRFPSKAEREWLARIHRELAGSFRYGALLDGFYVPRHKARRRRIPDRLAFAAHGRLGTGGRDTAWALHREHLRAGACLVLHGAAPDRLFPPATRREITIALRRERRHAREFLHQYPAYGVLNLCRLEYSQRRGDVVLSKLQAGRWALTHLKTWRPLVEAALRTYCGRASEGDARELARRTPDFYRSLSARNQSYSPRRKH